MLRAERVQSRRLPGAILGACLLSLAGVGAAAEANPAWARPASGDNDVLQWNALALQAVREWRFVPPPVVARALAVLHTCMFDAWAAYDDEAIATRRDGPGRQPSSDRTLEHRRRALNEAAYVAFADVFPYHRRLAEEQMARLGLSPRAAVSHQEPAGVGRAACQAVLRYRHADGANQLGEMNGGLPYSDYTAYQPVNTLTTLVDPNRWQPVASSILKCPEFIVPHWSRVAPFAFRPTAATRPPAPPRHPDPRLAAEAANLLALSASLTDEHKAIVEYWMDGPASETPPGHWNLFAQWVSRRDGHDLDRDMALFFVLNNALLDASIAAWDAKRFYDFVRPITALRQLYAGQRVRAWGGAFKGTREIDGAAWLPYQPAYFITPPHPEYVSAHSTFSAAAATVLTRFTGSDSFGGHHVVAAGSSRIEPQRTPAEPVVLSWATFDDAARQAGLSRRYGGIHFESADREGQRLGRAVAAAVWIEAGKHVRGLNRSSQHTAAPERRAPRAASAAR